MMQARARGRSRVIILTSLMLATTLVASCAKEERAVEGVTVPPPLSTTSTTEVVSIASTSTVAVSTTEEPTTTEAPTTTYEPAASGPASSVVETYAPGGGKRPRIRCVPGPDLGQLVLGANCRHVTIDGMPREYILYVPSTVKRETPAPLVVFLHGDDQNGDVAFRDTGWKRRADERGLVVAFPTSLEYDPLGADSDGWTFRWNGYELGDQVVRSQRVEGYPIASDIPADDVSFVRTMIDDIEYQWPIDPAKVFVAGFQSGAELATRLSIELPDRFAGMALSAGGLTSLAFDLPSPTRSIPILMMIGTDDAAYATRATSDGSTQVPLDGTVFHDSNVGQFTLQRLAALSGTDVEAATATSAQHLTTFSLKGDGIGGGKGLVKLEIINGLADEYPQAQNNNKELIGTVEISNFFDEVMKEIDGD
jgi:poly(3-hydroxybutyrate) depolymerase